MGNDRIERLASVLSDAGLDAFLATSPVSMGYLHGLFEDGHERLLTLAISARGEVRLICPALTANQAARIGIQDIRTWTDNDDPMELVRELADDWNLRSGIIAVDDAMLAAILLRLQAALPAALFRAGGPVLADLTARKSADEIAKLRAAAAIADAAWQEVKPTIAAGQTEEEVSGRLAAAMKARGGRPTFAIIATGANGAEPHHLSDSTVIRDGDVAICDFGCELDGYQSDITRTIAIGTPDPEAHRVYETVAQAHMAALAAARVGATFHDIDAAARSVIAEAGYGEYFVHRTGHGIGMQGHEPPYVVAGSQETAQTGHCFSIEPGIYLPGRFGVRLENIVAMGAERAESLNAAFEASL